MHKNDMTNTVGLQSNREFDKNAVYNEKILPLLEEVETICKREMIPMLVLVCTANNKQESIYRNSMVSPRYCQVHLWKDYISECLKILRGYRAVIGNDALNAGSLPKFERDSGDDLLADTMRDVAGSLIGLRREENGESNKRQLGEEDFWSDIASLYD